jgi:hypothetical protein
MSKLALLAAGLAIVIAGCGDAPKAADPNAPEVNSAGDIPDDQAFVRYAPPGAGFSVEVPEGWSRTAKGGAVTFTDKLNAIRIESAPAQAPPTKGELQAFHKGTVDSVKRQAGAGLRSTYLVAAKPSAVTGANGQDAVERYVFFHKGRDAILTLSGPKGADNVDPWQIVTDSLKWSR